MKRLNTMAAAVFAAALALAGAAEARDRDHGHGQGQGHGQGHGQDQGEHGRGQGRGHDDRGRGPDEARGDGRRWREGAPPGAYRGYTEGPAYEVPPAPYRGYAIRRGGRLPPGYGGAVVPDYGRHRLRPPPPGFAWVRMGDRYMLVQMGTGQIFDMIGE